MAGAPKGNKNAAKGRQWAAAIDRALSKRGHGNKVAALEKLAEVLLSKAEEGDMAALKELGDRIEGKPALAISADVQANVLNGYTFTVNRAKADQPDAD